MIPKQVAVGRKGETLAGNMVDGVPSPKKQPMPRTEQVITAFAAGAAGEEARASTSWLGQRLGQAPDTARAGNRRAHIVVVHDDETFRDKAATCLRSRGYDVRVFASVFAALDGLDLATADVLVTRIRFAPGQSNGVALGLMARQRQPGIKILFMAESDLREQAEGLGAFLATPISLPDLLDAVDRLLAPPAPETDRDISYWAPTAEKGANR